MLFSYTECSSNTESNVGLFCCKIMLTTYDFGEIPMWLKFPCDRDVAASEDGHLFLLSDNGEKLTQ